MIYAQIFYETCSTYKVYVKYITFKLTFFAVQTYTSLIYIIFCVLSYVSCLLQAPEYSFTFHTLTDVTFFFILFPIQCHNKPHNILSYFMIWTMQDRIFTILILYYLNIKMEKEKKETREKFSVVTQTEGTFTKGRLHYNFIKSKYFVMLIVMCVLQLVE